MNIWDLDTQTNIWTPQLIFGYLVQYPKDRLHHYISLYVERHDMHECIHNSSIIKSRWHNGIVLGSCERGCGFQTDHGQNWGSFGWVLPCFKLTSFTTLWCKWVPVMPCHLRADRSKPHPAWVCWWFPGIFTPMWLETLANIYFTLLACVLEQIFMLHCTCPICLL